MYILVPTEPRNANAVAGDEVVGIGPFPDADAAHRYRTDHPTVNFPEFAVVKLLAPDTVA